jgi:hypothetical protein
MVHLVNDQQRFDISHFFRMINSSSQKRSAMSSSSGLVGFSAKARDSLY